MRHVARRQRTPVAAGCLLAALALALLSLAAGARAAHLPVPPALRAAVAQATAVLRPADPARTDPSALAAAPRDRGAPPVVPYALLPTALALAAALGILVGRARRTGRPARPRRGAPTGRGPPPPLLLAT